jgi:probable HAF family extracellular repeat protein
MHGSASTWLHYGKMFFSAHSSDRRFFHSLRKNYLNLSLAIALIGQIFLLTASAQVKYTITRLVPLEGVRSSAGGINSQGDAVGNYFWRSAPNINHVFLNHAGIMHDIGSFGAATSASGINIYGRIVGQASVNHQTVAYTYFEHQFWLIKNLSSPKGVNTAGHVLTTTGIWQKSGFTAFATPAGKAFEPLAINNLDQAAGYLIDQNRVTHALLYSGGQEIDLGTLPGINFTSSASGINDEGQVTGYSDSSMGRPHAFIYTSGQMQDIHSIGPQYASFGGAINNLGQVVGVLEYSSTPNGLGRAFLYDGSQMVDLNMLIAPNSGWVLNYALAINDAGQILGDGVYNGENYQEAFLLTPVR